MDGAAWIAVMGITIGTAALVCIRLNRREDTGDERPHGDEVHLPSDFHSTSFTTGAERNHGPH